MPRITTKDCDSVLDYVRKATGREPVSDCLGNPDKVTDRTVVRKQDVMRHAGVGHSAVEQVLATHEYYVVEGRQKMHGDLFALAEDCKAYMHAGSREEAPHPFIPLLGRNRSVLGGGGTAMSVQGTQDSGGGGGGE